MRLCGREDAWRRHKLDSRRCRHEGAVNRAIRDASVARGIGDGVRHGNVKAALPVVKRSEK